MAAWTVQRSAGSSLSLPDDGKRAVTSSGDVIVVRPSEQPMAKRMKELSSEQQG